MPISEPPATDSLQHRCAQLQEFRPFTSRQILEPFALLEGHPWAETAASDLTTYYACLHGITQPEKPRKILEVGTAFGMSAATFLSASPGIELFISLDLGIYGGLLGSQESNIDFARSHIHEWCRRHQVDTRRVRFYQANTQPPGQGDNDNQGLDAPRWCLLPEVVRLLQEHQFDIVFVDGKHTDDGLLNDMKTFWPFLKPGGLMICDDLHHPEEYAGSFSWVGHTWQSFHRFLEERAGEIAEHVLWDFPRVPPAGKMGLRPFGLVRKSSVTFPAVKNPAFEMFDSDGALAINRARQDHLASLGLDLAGRSVLEVGAGVGWHTGFFERLGCSILTTDARPENVAETLQRFPYRTGHVEVADLSVPGSHVRFGDFDIIYCYGTLYHLREPALCLQDLACRCRGLLLLETCVYPSDNGQINLVAEQASNPNQSFQGIGCRPGRDWIRQELLKHFPHVYVSVTQPAFPDFVLEWPALPKQDTNFRAIFVASRVPLALATLVNELPVSQTRLNPVSESDYILGTAPAASLAVNNLAPKATATLSLDCPSPSKGEPEASRSVAGTERSMHEPDLDRLRYRIGHLLQRPGPISQEELRAATDTFNSILDAENPVEFIALYRSLFPETLLPLLLFHLGLAWARGDELMAEGLETLFGHLTAPVPDSASSKIP
jgi:predicted O-methyltransferase YrrM